MAQFQAGYFLDSIFDLFKNKSYKNKIEGLVNYLSYFELDTNNKLDSKNSSNLPILSIANNLITRGLPTRPSTFIEDIFATSFSKTKKQIDKHNNISYDLNSSELKAELYRALHIIDPRINKNNQTADIFKKWTKKGAEFKEYFLYSHIPEYIGEHFLQLIDIDRSFESILKNSYKDFDVNAYLNNNKYDFLKKNVDFSIELPYNGRTGKGIIIEINEGQFEENYDYEKVKLNREITNKINWADTLQIHTSNITKINSMTAPLRNFTYNEFFDNILVNYSKPLYKNQDGLDALQLVLSPIAIARIQKTIIEYILSGQLNLNSKTWEIAIIERDVPCGFLAIEDLKQLIKNLFTIEGKNNKLPNINIVIHRTNEFKKAKLNVLYQGEIKDISKFDSQKAYDLVIDISVLQRKGIKNKKINTLAKNIATIKSVKKISSKRRFYANKLIKYKSIFGNNNKIDNELKSSYQYFLKNIFRKQDFINNQLNIINEILQLNNTLALVPTGGGKTLSYQLSVLFQPAVSLVVHPLISLMKDQATVLKRNRIDAYTSINSSLKKTYYKNIVYNEFSELSSLFAFVSPENFKIKNFRNTLLSMRDNSFFAYCVIDEAHCVSEWGHDFRYNYVGIADDIRKYCKSKTLNNIPIVGLTATASFDVLDDIKNQLKIDNKSIIKTNIGNAKLNFDFLDVSSNNINTDTPIERAKELVALRKQVSFTYIVKNIFYKGRVKQSDCDTLIYCPEPFGFFGITDENGDGLSDKLKNNFSNLKIGNFFGTSDDTKNPVSLSYANESIDSYYNFINNKLDVLVATNAFGIGINKQDIRNIIYFNMPNSVESFIQQTNRSGRDGKETDCTVLFDKQKLHIKQKNRITDENGRSYLSDEIASYTVDKYYAREGLKKHFKGKEKEKRIVDELFNQISFPSVSYSNIICEQLENEFDEKFSFSYQPKEKPTRLYINNRNKTYGYIDYKTNKINTDIAAYNVGLSERILNYVKYEIDIRYSDNDVISWLKNEKAPYENNGVGFFIKNNKIGDRQEIKINFQNDSIDIIFELLTKYTTQEFNKNDVNKLCQNTINYNDFIKKINNIAKVNIVNKKINLPKELEKQFVRFRTKHDTFNAIYRLYTIGIIDDYTVDENSRTINMYLTRKPEYEHKNILYNYLIKYISIEASKKAINSINGKKDIFVKNTVYYLIDFVYENIAAKRYKAIDIIEKICILASDDLIIENKKNSLLSDFFGKYFDAKYANNLMFPSLSLDIKSTNKYDFSIVSKYIIHIGNSLDSWQHMKNSTEILLVKSKSYVLLLLNAYCSILLSNKNEKLFNEALNNTINGFSIMRNSLDSDKYSKNVEFFLNKLYEKDLSLKNKIEPLIHLKTHSSWLSDFNTKFLENYER